MLFIFSNDDLLIDTETEENVKAPISELRFQ